MTIDPALLSYDERSGLLPVVVQDVASGAVLMLAWANREAVVRTLESGEAHFWSRSRQELWRKGETSGHTLSVVEVLEDCDGDALLVRAEPRGPTCHRLTRSCFEPNVAQLELGWLWAILEGRRDADPEDSYTARLLREGVDRMAQKVGEEATEVVVAAVRSSKEGNEAGRARVVSESADLLYHLLVLWQGLEVEPREVIGELLRRHRRREKDATEGGRRC